VTALEDIHERSIGPIAEIILRPTLEAGGEPADTLALLDSICAAVLAIAVRPEADKEPSSFYAWNRVHLFMAAWRNAGFRPVGHIVFRKRYASAARLLRYEQEVAYLLAKGDAQPPAQPIPDVIEFRYTGNKLHPTQKPIAALAPLISAFCPPGGRAPPGETN
jgi:hypothetical protein